jgi:hypothetical protein
VSWTARASNRSWQGIASSADGLRLAAVEEDAQIYTSTNGGVSWSVDDQIWNSIASSADGLRLAATDGDNGFIYISTDGGVNWTARESNRNWGSIASSADGMRLAAAVWGGQIYTSTDGGVNWTARESNRNWLRIVSSADGMRLAAVVAGGQIYTNAVTCTGGGSAGGVSGQVMFNNNGNVAGNAGLTYDVTNTRLTATNVSATALSVSGAATAGTLGTGGLTVSGGTSLNSVSATVGDFATLRVGGVAVTGGGTPDRIVGSNANVVAGGGMVSISTGGVTGTAYFDTSGRLVAPGVSATGGISGTTGYFGGSVEVSGSVVSRAFNAGSATSIDWLQGNSQYTSASCGAFTFSNMLDGGQYVLAVQGTSSGTCSFSHTGLTFRMPPVHGATTAGQHTLYAFNRMGSFVYVSWINGM